MRADPGGSSAADSGGGGYTGAYHAADAGQLQPRIAAGSHLRRRGRSLRLLVFSPYFPPHVGGLEGYAGDLGDALCELAQVEAVTVLAPRLPPEGAPEERRGCSLILRYPAFELIGGFPVPRLWDRELWRVVRRADIGGHDVIVSHTRFFLSSAWALVCARRARRPLLHVEHGSDFVQLAGRFVRAAARTYDLTLGRAVLRLADEVVAVSGAAAEFVAQLAGRQAPVVYRGMHAERLLAGAPDPGVAERADGRVVVAFAGRLIDGKGVADLLRAFARLQRGSAMLCVVGDGPRRADLEGLARELALAADVEFLGYLPEARAWEVMRAAAVIVNPSYTEGLPTSVLEAALMGKAILASDVGGTREIVSDERGGLLYAPRDVDALRARLERLVGDPQLRARLGAAAREEAGGRFDWRVSAERFSEIAAGLVRARDDQAPARAASTSSKTDS